MKPKYLRMSLLALFMLAIASCETTATADESHAWVNPTTTEGYSGEVPEPGDRMTLTTSEGKYDYVFGWQLCVDRDRIFPGGLIFTTESGDVMPHGHRMTHIPCSDGTIGETIEGEELVTGRLWD